MVHDSSGERIACGIITVHGASSSSAPPAPPTPAPPPSSGGCGGLCKGLVFLGFGGLAGFVIIIWCRVPVRFGRKGALRSAGGGGGGGGVAGRMMARATASGRGSGGLSDGIYSEELGDGL